MARKHYERRRRTGLPLSEIVVEAVSETQHRLGAAVDLRLQKLPECLDKLTDEQRSLLEQCYGGEGTIAPRHGAAAGARRDLQAAGANPPQLVRVH